MFKFDGPLFKFLGRIFDIILLNVIWGICSLPVFTIGASTTALYYTILKIIKDEESYILKDFFRAFKENFKQATIVWLILLILGLLLILGGLKSLGIWIVHSEEIGLISLYFITFLVILYSMVLLYIFPLISKFENNIKNLLKLSLLLPIKHLLWTIIMFGVVFLVISLSYIVPFFTVFYIGIIAFLNSFIFNHIFNMYIENNDIDKN